MLGEKAIVFIGVSGGHFIASYPMTSELEVRLLRITV